MKKDEISLQTRRLLAVSLKKFMAKKPFDKITVSEILEDCEIARPTFYYHFQDIYALLEWTFDTEAIELLKKSKDYMTWDEGLLLMLQYIKDNEKVCLCAYNSLGWRVLERMISKDTIPLMRQFVEQLAVNTSAKPDHIAFITEFYATALVGCYAKWLSGGMKQTPEEMIDLIYIAMYGGIEVALERSAKSKKE